MQSFYNDGKLLIWNRITEDNTTLVHGMSEMTYIYNGKLANNDKILSLCNNFSLMRLELLENDGTDDVEILFAPRKSATDNE